ncbi:MAG TPA: PAS domain-containing protein [Chloroflexota bacterium]|nr:PAS domain-containing protein [Chloroflexota bacterium]
MDLSWQFARALGQAFAGTVDGVYVYDREGRFLFVNPAGARHCGLEPSAMLGKTWREAGIAAWVMQPLDPHLAGVFATGRPVTVESTNDDRAYEHVLSPIPGDDDGIVAAVATTRDLTEGKRAALEHRAALDREREARGAAERARDRIAVLQSVTARLTAALTAEQVAEVIVDEGTRALGVAAETALA